MRRGSCHVGRSLVPGLVSAQRNDHVGGQFADGRWVAARSEAELLSSAGTPTLMETL